MTGPATTTDEPAALPVAGPQTAGAAPAHQTSIWWVLALCIAAVIAAALQVLSGQGQRGFYLLVLSFLICTVAAWIDVATRRIPNTLTYPAILVGLALNALAPPILGAVGADAAVVWSGATGPRDGLLGFGLCAAIGVVSFIARGLGGGDVKLLAALGAMLGLQAVVPVLVNTLVIAALIGVINWAVRGTLLPRVQVAAGNLLVALVTRKPLEVYPFGRSEAPFGVALLLGLILAQFIGLHELVLPANWFS